MTPQQWNKVQELFASASSIELADRAAFLKQACEGDPELLAEVSSLLACQPATSSYLETPAINLQTIFSETIQAHTDQLDPMLGHELASYTIQRRLGTGGMGVVYLAQQRSPRRTVALKLIRPGLASPELLKRFDHEAQALGRLKHPGIAQIYEAGTAQTPLGLQPYFAMEYVAGQPLLEYAAQQGLNARERLELIARICDAVQHAHSKGVIHRDIKPSNVIVEVPDVKIALGPTATPSTPATSAPASTPGRKVVAQPKILDFGVASVADSDTPSANIDPPANRIVGTLAYMSPEQLGARPATTPFDSSVPVGETIDTRTDVYALGVMAYELLTGRLPNDVRGMSLAECVRV
ncbi:MAG: serine/threonine protein kinase, partial [Pyrinomonadaceae bacterium]|nr:serine/threonine protein kinase [Phycisphaerales bacterium]